MTTKIISNQYIKLLVLGFVFIFNSYARADLPVWLADGTYGSNTLYCGMRILHDPRYKNDSNKEALIVTYVNNPGIDGHICTAPGSTQIFKYDIQNEYYLYANGVDSYCIISFTNNDVSFYQTCFWSDNDAVRSSIFYQRYY